MVRALSLMRWLRKQRKNGARFTCNRLNQPTAADEVVGLLCGKTFGRIEVGKVNLTPVGPLEVAMTDVGHCARVVPDAAADSLHVSVEQAALATFVVEQPALALEASRVTGQ